MAEFIAVNTKKSTQLTKALVVNTFSYSPILPTSGNLTWKQEPEKDKQNFQLMQFYQNISSQRWRMNCNFTFLVNN